MHKVSRGLSEFVAYGRCLAVILASSPHSRRKRSRMPCVPYITQCDLYRNHCTEEVA